MKCQKCRQPIRLHGSLDDMSPAAFDLLLSASSNSNQLLSEQPITPKAAYPRERRDVYERASKQSEPPLFRRVVPPRSTSSSTSLGHSRSLSTPNMAPSRSVYDASGSFVVLTDSQVIPPPPQTARHTSNMSVDDNIAEPNDQNALSLQMNKSARLFEILSARSDIDHPICQECTELLVDGLTKRLQNSTRERDAFIEFLKRTNAEIPTEAERQAAEEELRMLEAEEQEALRELEQAEAEQAEADAEIRRLEEESRRLDEEEEAFWRERNTFALKLEEFQNERDGVNLQYDHDARQLEKLQRTNVYNDTFCIGHDGYFGTINGLRLGRLPNQPVEWAEINAAWGQTLLLLATVAEKLNFTFDSYRLKPMGSTSKIEKIDSPSSSTAEAKVTTLELFSSGDLPIGRMFMHRKFDQAMVAFLECLRQLGEFVERTDPQMKLPYKINKDKIEDSCIRLAFNQDEAWTRACKYTLTCVKFLLAHTSNAAYAKRSGNP